LTTVRVIMQPMWYAYSSYKGIGINSASINGLVSHDLAVSWWNKKACCPVMTIYVCCQCLS